MFSKKRIVLNVDGLEWKREKWGKLARWYLRNAERLAVKSADLVIADNKVIQKHLLESYGRQSTLIAYGADHVLKIPLSDEIKREFTFLNKPYAFKVCRIEPENNVEMILQAFAQIEDLPLVIIGNWNSSEFGLNLREKYIQPHLHLLDPIYDQQLLDQIRSNCLVYIHGHSAGGTNPSLVEAMYLSLPILAFDVQYNRETTENKALSYFKNTSDLKQSIQVLNEKTCVESGNEMKAIAEARYTWKIITDKYKSIF
jgi:glycosyltransferase involved in cell wall biosynthesis